MKIFNRSSNKKAVELQQQLEALAIQKQELEQAQRWNELRLENQLKQQQAEHDRKHREWEEAEAIRAERESANKAAQARADAARRAEEEAERDREKERRSRMQATTPEALRALRDLIRTRYQLDMYIWSLKGARGPDRHLVVEKMEKADAVLQEIHSIVDTWTENEKVWTREEWRLAMVIRERLKAPGKRQWTDNPPWNE
jgi:hypothetical protein